MLNRQGYNIFSVFSLDTYYCDYSITYCKSHLTKTFSLIPMRLESCDSGREEKRFTDGKWWRELWSFLRYVSNILISRELTHCDLSGYQSFKKQQKKPKCALVRSFLSQPNDLQVTCFTT